MEPYQLIDADDRPIDASQRTKMIARCADLIERTNVVIQRHAAQPLPDQLAIEENTDLREQYIAELTQLLQEIGVVVQLSSDTTDAKKTIWQPEEQKVEKSQPYLQSWSDRFRDANDLGDITSYADETSDSDHSVSKDAGGIETYDRVNETPARDMAQPKSTRQKR